MYVLIVAGGIPSEKNKGHGIFEFDQAKALAKSGCKVVYAVVDLRSIRHIRKFGRESYKKSGVQVESINLPCGRVPRRILQKTGEIGLSILYKSIERKYGKPDIVHAHFTLYGYISKRAKGIRDIPIVITEHSSLLNKDKVDNETYMMAEFAYEKSDRIIAVSSALADKIKKNFLVNATCIPNIVDTEIFNYKIYNKNKLFNFVSVGNLVPGKRMDMLIESFLLAFPDNSNVQLFIFGKGDEKSKLESLINKNNLSDRVFLMGECHRTQISKKFQECDCFVLASQRETFGVAYIEAMSAGLPVIATSCGGPEDFVNQTNGLLVPVDNKKTLVDAMKHMYLKADTYNRRKISDKIKERFSSQIVAKRLLEIYQDILEKTIVN